MRISLRPLRACTLVRHPFSRSYGVILPSSLPTVLTSSFGYSPRLPVSVCGTVPIFLLRGFSRQRGIGSFQPYGLLLCASLLSAGGFAYQHQLTRIEPHSHRRSCLSFCVTPSSNEIWEVRNINRMSIGYASRPHLRDRLTLSGLTFLRKP